MVFSRTLKFPGGRGMVFPRRLKFSGGGYPGNFQGSITYQLNMWGFDICVADC